jgi:hypothetical protein
MLTNAVLTEVARPKSSLMALRFAVVKSTVTVPLLGPVAPPAARVRDDPVAPFAALWIVTNAELKLATVTSSSNESRNCPASTSSSNRVKMGGDVSGV